MRGSEAHVMLPAITLDLRSRTPAMLTPTPTVPLRPGARALLFLFLFLLQSACLLLQPARLAAQDAAADDAPEVGMSRASAFGEDLSEAEALDLLREMVSLAQGALEATRAAEEDASSVAGVKLAAERAFQAVWGLPSGITEGGTPEVAAWGWKERWQVTGGEFDPDFVERLGEAPPVVTDPLALGIMGRGRAVQGRLEARGGGSVQAFWEPAGPLDEALASLNNVVGWTYLTTGRKIREVQPRFSLTHLWDAPKGFWQSTADTGWIHEVHAQAVNILKTHYGDDQEEVRRHLADLSALLEKVLAGVDRDGDGAVRPLAMEGGLEAALAAAERAAAEGPGVEGKGG